MKLSSILVTGIITFALAGVIFQNMNAQDTRMETYCNPLNLDYTYMIYNAYNDLSYRSGADPAVVEFRNEYYMFVTRSMGYWHSPDLQNWNFIEPPRWYFQGSNAPAAFNYKDSLLFMAGDPSGSMSILYTDDPKGGEWKATPAILNGLQDPDLFIDDDGQAYIFWGSSNKFPIRGRRLDMKNKFRPDDEVDELFNLDEEKHGWERFGENHADTVLGGYIEGAWLTKHAGKYYMQYAAPGTEFNVYADGIYTSDAPLGPYRYAPNNPAFYKPGGYANGVGHGSIVKGPQGRYWHFGTMAVGVNVGWERRIVMHPLSFNDEGLMEANTYFGDYPHYAPEVPEKAGEFAGWMLLSYNKPSKASSQEEGHGPGLVVDENVKTFWLAKNNGVGEWLQIDLQKPAMVYAIQVNYNDYQSDMYGRIPGLKHRYLIKGSLDGQNWQVLVDRSDNYRDVPNDYVELGNPRRVRYLRYENILVPTPYLSISALRVFGKGEGRTPAKVKAFKVNRKTDRRNALITWEPRDNTQGYNVLWGIAPGELHHSWMVYGDNELLLKSLTVDQDYYFAIEAFNEKGISQRSEEVYVK